MFAAFLIIDWRICLCNQLLPQSRRIDRCSLWSKIVSRSYCWPDLRLCFIIDSCCNQDTSIDKAYCIVDVFLRFYFFPRLAYMFLYSTHGTVATDCFMQHIVKVLLANVSFDRFESIFVICSEYNRDRLIDKTYCPPEGAQPVESSMP